MVRSTRRLRRLTTRDKTTRHKTTRNNRLTRKRTTKRVRGGAYDIYGNYYNDMNEPGLGNFLNKTLNPYLWYQAYKNKKHIKQLETQQRRQEGLEHGMRRENQERQRLLDAVRHGDSP